MNDGCKEGSQDTWEPCSSFPAVENDVLLYLLFMGGKDYSAFLDGKNSKPVPFSRFLLNNRAAYNSRGNRLDYGNKIQKSNSGQFLESLLATTVCVASHANGIIGIDTILLQALDLRIS
jgi:hypothetical protein